MIQSNSVRFPVRASSIIWWLTWVWVCHRWHAVVKDAWTIVMKLTCKIVYVKPKLVLYYLNFNSIHHITKRINVVVNILHVCMHTMWWPLFILHHRQRSRLATCVARRRKSCWSSWMTWRSSFPSSALPRWPEAQLPSSQRCKYNGPLFPPQLVPRGCTAALGILLSEKVSWLFSG